MLEAGSSPASSTIIRQIEVITAPIYTTPILRLEESLRYSPIEVRRSDLIVIWCFVSINQKHYGEGSIRINNYEQLRAGELHSRVRTA